MWGGVHTNAKNCSTQGDPFIEGLTVNKHTHTPLPPPFSLPNSSTTSFCLYLIASSLGVSSSGVRGLRGAFRISSVWRERGGEREREASIPQASIPQAHPRCILAPAQLPRTMLNYLSSRYMYIPLIYTPLLLCIQCSLHLGMQQCPDQ